MVKEEIKKVQTEKDSLKKEEKKAVGKESGEVKEKEKGKKPDSVEEKPKEKKEETDVKADKKDEKKPVDVKDKAGEKSGKPVSGESQEKPVSGKEQVKEVEKKEPAVEMEKEMSPKVSEALQLVKAMSADERTGFGVAMIKELRVLELAGWVKSLEKEFGVSAQAAVVSAAPGGAGSAAAPAEEQKDSYTVVLASVGDKKIQVIKEVRTITSLGLREAKALVDEAPKPVKEDVNEQEANEIKAKLESAGATVELK